MSRVNFYQETMNAIIEMDYNLYDIAYIFIENKKISWNQFKEISTIWYYNRISNNDNQLRKEDAIINPEMKIVMRDGNYFARKILKKGNDLIECWDLVPVLSPNDKLDKLSRTELENIVNKIVMD